MIYTLWDSDSGNAIAGFATEAEALAVVRAEIEAGGSEAVSEWFLGKEDSRGRSKLVAEGARLAKRAQMGTASSKAAT